MKLGGPGAAPSPAMVKLPTDQAESSAKTTPPTIAVALTRQKYVPLGRPLSLSCVGAGMVSAAWFVAPAAMIDAKVDVVDTCHV